MKEIRFGAWAIENNPMKCNSHFLNWPGFWGKPMRIIAASLVVISIFNLGWVRSADATPPSAAVAVPDENEEPATTQPGNGATSPISDFVAGLPRSSYLLGNMGGLRTLLSKYGMTLTIEETSEVLGNVSGGVRQGADYDGLTQMDLQLDTKRAFNFYGGTFNVSGLQIHGRNLSADDLDTLQTASGIEGDRSSRLWELWYDQKFLEEDRLDVKIGQQSLDQEFMVSQNAGLFVNTMFGWPMVPSADLPGGGPAYPLSALGVRARARPTDSLTFLAGIFNGSPVSNGLTGDPQQENATGTAFPLNGGALAIAEMQYSYPAVGGMVSPDESDLLAGTYKLGIWYDTESFADLEFDNTGLPLASPHSSGVPRMYHGDYGIYAVVDQMLWHDEDDPDKALSVFVRPMGTPEEDRNLIVFSLNAGLTLHDPIPHRDDDTIGIGMGYAKVSGRASDADEDRSFYNPGTFNVVRSDETYVEATYQYELTPWCEIQPDFQYVFNPGGGLVNPNAPDRQIKNETVIGVRVNILF
jgi:porin